MKTYTIRYEEKNIAYIDIPAENAVEAMGKAEAMKQSGEIDSKLEAISSSVAVVGSS